MPADLPAKPDRIDVTDLLRDGLLHSRKRRHGNKSRDVSPVASFAGAGWPTLGAVKISFS